jgi:hypothetical protein
MPAIATILKKWIFKWWGCGPSDCQKKFVLGVLNAVTEHPGLLDDTVQHAREDISLRPGGVGGGALDSTSPSCSTVSGLASNNKNKLTMIVNNAVS